MNEYEQNLIDEIIDENVDNNIQVTDEEIATSIMKRLKYINMLKEQNKVIAKGEIDKINLWKDEANKDLNEKVKYYEEVLLQFYQKQLEVNPKYKLNTPYGKVSKRNNKKWIYDEEKIIEFLEENMYMSMIVIEKGIKKLDIKKAFPNGIDECTGEVIEGIQIIEETNYNIKLI